MLSAGKKGIRPGDTERVSLPDHGKEADPGNDRKATAFRQRQGVQKREGCGRQGQSGLYPLHDSSRRPSRRSLTTERDFESGISPSSKSRRGLNLGFISVQRSDRSARGQPPRTVFRRIPAPPRRRDRKSGTSFLSRSHPAEWRERALHFRS